MLEACEGSEELQYITRILDCLDNPENLLDTWPVGGSRSCVRVSSDAREILIVARPQTCFWLYMDVKLIQLWVSCSSVPAGTSPMNSVKGDADHWKHCLREPGQRWNPVVDSNRSGADSWRRGSDNRKEH
jgi:hypothetical protein